jgi:tetratricopeptide (TPR) repeat protein
MPVRRPGQAGWTRTARALTACCVLIALPALFSARAEPTEDAPAAAMRDADYAAGKAAMERKDWAEAVRRLQLAAVRDPDSADLQNHLGYSYRNLRNFPAALQHYQRAIALNPRHRGAHEYIGEAYLMLDDLPNAEKHVTALRGICLLPCEELADLEKAVQQYRVRTGSK